jgi:ech hydrogenase subunit A
MYFFWEVTTLCSFALIGHDGTEIAKANAKRALWMNLLGGVAFVFGIIVAYGQAHTLSVQELLQAGATSSIAMLPLALLCFAGFTKSAQVPFQSWLLGAMVAPTPVSALLHSSTMVKAGVYLIVRLAPAYHGTALSTVVAIFGAFTFVAASALAVSQSNGKKILAYSTIANLGLIVACAGINTPAAISAAILLIIFHAISKGLLFLCVGSIEQTIGSRDIEDMRGLYAKMPTTAMITAIGILTMLLPPFGVLLSKWIAIEAASRMLLVVVMLAMGSALTVVFWARWAGMLMTGTIGKPAAEKKSPLMMGPLYFLLASAVVMSFLSPVVYKSLIGPVLDIYYRAGAFASDFGSLAGQAGSFAVLPLFFIFAVILVYSIRVARKSAASAACAPYACGENNPDPTKAQYRLAWLGWVDAKAGNFYLTEYLGEEKVTTFINIAAATILIMMIGGLL